MLDMTMTVVAGVRRTGVYSGRANARWVGNRSAGSVCERPEALQGDPDVQGAAWEECSLGTRATGWV